MRKSLILVISMVIVFIISIYVILEYIPIPSFLHLDIDMIPHEYRVILIISLVTVFLYTLSIFYESRNYEIYFITRDGAYISLGLFLSLFTISIRYQFIDIIHSHLEKCAGGIIPEKILREGVMGPGYFTAWTSCILIGYYIKGTTDLTALLSTIFYLLLTSLIILFLLYKLYELGNRAIDEENKIIKIIAKIMFFTLSIYSIRTIISTISLRFTGFLVWSSIMILGITLSLITLKNAIGDAYSPITGIEDLTSAFREIIDSTIKDIKALDKKSLIPVKQKKRHLNTIMTRLKTRLDEVLTRAVRGGTIDHDMREEILYFISKILEYHLGKEDISETDIDKTIEFLEMLIVEKKPQR